MSRHTFVIAEAASAHDGDFGKASRLVYAASNAGADAFKVQFWSDPDLLADRRRVPDYYREFYRRYALPYEWLPRLAALCEIKSLEFMCTVFLPDDVPVLAPYLNRWKVSSFEAMSADVLRRISDESSLPVIVSCGMGADVDMTEIGGGDSLLHCVSAYPAPLESLNLASAFSVGDGGYDGFSDHSGQLEAGAFAVCAGARIVEVHMRLRETDPENPDGGPFALLPEHLVEYVRLIRKAETMLGDGSSWSSLRMQPCEEPMARYRVVNR